MRLVDLNPRWVGAGGEGVLHRNAAGELEPAPERHGVGVSFDCPCGTHEDREMSRCYIPFTNPLDGGAAHAGEAPTWERTGDTFDTLTLSPSILRIGGCAWHGYIRNGEVTQ